MKEFHKIEDTTLIGSWEEIQGLQLSTITKNDEDTDKLDGLIVKGYETKFGSGTNTNGERYSKDAIDRFINEYFVGKKLNMPVDIEHDSRPEWLAGRVIYIESNTTGFYFVAYVPRTFMNYEAVKNMLADGILQGFSKCGWATDWEVHYKEDGSFDYEEIKEMQIVRMSIVSTPANGINFERIQEVQNRLKFVNKNTVAQTEEKQKEVAFADLFS